MIRKPNIDIKDYSYDLPEERIAQFPLEQRDDSKLLIWNECLISDDHFSNIDKYIPANSIMVFNDTKVIRARLIFTKSTGAAIEIFCLEPITGNCEPDHDRLEKGVATWQCLIGNVKRWKEERLEKSIQKKNGETLVLSAEKKEFLGDGCFSVDFKWEPSSCTFSEILETAGQVPLPPYIHRPTVNTDVSQYQTIYAKHDGSVAAPTAGLHFTTAVLEKLRHKGIISANVTLHVGLGTFRPVNVPLIADHIMHNEKIIVKLETIKKLIENPEKPVIAIGTTSVRTLESLYWSGVKMLVDNQDQIADVDQWDPYDDRYDCGISKMDALQKLVDYLIQKNHSHYSANTRLLITPGYEIKMIDGLITNFHLPQSTLLLLISAFIGSEWRDAYNYALRNNFRFLSYGDVCLFLKTKK